ncbi:hypothetical protein [Gracilibacillus dipsosauri]|uniref:Uncharacterized protein n=1 Tax=Gracilibacillus dipsosauri TaxID=178340 RepID=A0A317KSJ3_9BACI|nr:hypothetical protein [Gracilibacillus dipsosauri]PWU66552.1 hypothetical protein DLJ74_19195 [Gracilibacillus dipsosauri]
MDHPTTEKIQRYGFPTQKPNPTVARDSYDGGPIKKGDTVLEYEDYVFSEDALSSGQVNILRFLGAVRKQAQ